MLTMYLNVLDRSLTPTIENTLRSPVSSTSNPRGTFRHGLARSASMRLSSIFRKSHIQGGHKSILCVGILAWSLPKEYLMKDQGFRKINVSSCLDPKSMYNHGPKQLTHSPKAIISHAFGVQVGSLGTSVATWEVSVKWARTSGGLMLTVQDTGGLLRGSLDFCLDSVPCSIV